ncbi:MAG: hypothetical protein KBA51_04795 [Kiritimatiellae bacterium]|nr:hypothetical protein [Kiritimatiellia bacterium]
MARVWRWSVAGVVISASIWLFIIPGLIVVRHLSDPAIRSNRIPRASWDLFRSLTPRYEVWARERVQSGHATTLDVEQIAATEWPVFGSVFYLWAVELLQEEWEKDPTQFPVAPKEYARGAIEAAAALIMDPGHAKWVKDHWGDAYLDTQNFFYRALLIAGATANHRLLGDTRYDDVLRKQVESLSSELDASKHGMLCDYPNECYPGDVLMGIVGIREADHVLGTDHSAFAARAVRGFSGSLLDHRGLIPYDANDQEGTALHGSRGCGMSYALFTAPYVWPDRAREWYALYEKYFWQEGYGLSGFREFPNDRPGYQWHMDVDSGPVVGGMGVAASAFGVAAARVNGRFDHAYPLTAETIAFSWPLPGGTLLMPRVLSNAAHAPMLGEACLLFSLSRVTAPGFEMKPGGRIPPLVWAGTALYFVLGVFFIGMEVHALRRAQNRGEGQKTMGT